MVKNLLCLEVYNKRALIAAICILCISFFASLYIAGTVDLVDFWTFHEASRLGNPYEVVNFLNPAWTHAIIFPLRFMPQQVAYAIWMTISTGIVLWGIHRMGGDRLSYILVFLNPFFFSFVTKGNIEVLVLLGLIIEARPFDVLLLLVKPQMGITAAAYKLLGYGQGDWLRLAAAVGLTFVVWGNWPLEMARNWLQGLVVAGTSVDIWPYGALAGIVLLFVAYRERSLTAVFLAGYLLAPYISHNSLFIYTVVIFSTFQKSNRIIVFCSLYLFFAVALLIA